MLTKGDWLLNDLQNEGLNSGIYWDVFHCPPRPIFPLFYSALGPRRLSFDLHQVQPIGASTRTGKRRRRLFFERSGFFPSGPP